MGDSEEAFEYDIALSFAGEDRSYVRPIAERLRELAVPVFYDEFHAAEMWGEDLPVFFDDIFRKSSRYAVLFISRNYVEKVWPRLERQSAQARSLVQESPYILPVRLDDSELPGLRPTVGYIDVRVVGRDRLIELILAKLNESRPIDRVPRTPEEEAALLISRPGGWEYNLFAAILLRERERLDAKWQDHQLRFVRGGRPALGDMEAFEMVRGLPSRASAITGNVERLFGKDAQEVAFGPAGSPGDPDRIEHLARRIIQVYEDLLDWAAEVRSTPVPEQWRPVTEVASRFVDAPIREIREFVDSAVEQLDRLPGQLREGSDERIELTLRLVLTIGAGLVDEFTRALDQIDFG